MRRTLGVLSILALLPVLATAVSTQVVWTEDPAVLTRNHFTYAGPGSYYTEDIILRSGQERLYFDMGPAPFLEVKVRITAPYVGQCETVYFSSTTPLQGVIRWPGVPTGAGQYRIEVFCQDATGFSDTYPYDLVIVPAAQRGFRDGSDNTMMLWSGTTAALDQPFLVVEGFDASNINSAGTYYALGSLLFATGRRRGADVMILNFKDGGVDMRQNAAVVNRAIVYLNGIRTGPRRLDVAGLSMGGVVARYALARMESQGIAHNVQRFVSIDAPQQGAVIDHELQRYIKNDLREDNWPENLVSVAAKQLLEFSEFDNSGLHDSFCGDLATMNGDGYPHQTVENVGVAFSTPNPNPDTD